MAHPVVVFDVRRGRLLIGEREELATLLEVEPEMAPDEGTKPAHPRQAAQPSDASPGSATNGNRISVRDFARRFAHRKLYERIAILLYYAHRMEDRSTLTSRDLRDWFGLCGFKTPVRMDKALDNVMRQRRIVERTGPGQWTLTTAGESVALDLLESADANGNS